MKIPFEDRRTNMKRRWCDIRKINKFRFHEIVELIEGCNEIGKEEFLQLKQMIENKLMTYNA